MDEQLKGTAALHTHPSRDLAIVMMRDSEGEYRKRRGSLHMFLDHYQRCVNV